MIEPRFINMRLEESRGVRRCGKCKASIHPGVLNLVHISLIWTPYALKYKHTGEAYQKKHYCLACAKPFVENGIIEARKKALEANKIFKIFKDKKNNQNLKKMAWERVKTYKKYLRIVKNWNRYLDQIIDHDHRRNLNKMLTDEMQ